MVFQLKSYSGIIVVEAGIVDWKDLRPFFMRLLPSTRKRLAALPAIRKSLQDDLRGKCIRDERVPHFFWLPLLNLVLASLCSVHQIDRPRYVYRVSMDRSLILGVHRLICDSSPLFYRSRRTLLWKRCRLEDYTGSVSAGNRQHRRQKDKLNQLSIAFRVYYFMLAARANCSFVCPT
jgi:hypothetical protein